MRWNISVEERRLPPSGKLFARSLIRPWRYINFSRLPSPFSRELSAWIVQILTINVGRVLFKVETVKRVIFYTRGELETNLMFNQLEIELGKPLNCEMNIEWLTTPFCSTSSYIQDGGLIETEMENGQCQNTSLFRQWYRWNSFPRKAGRAEFSM